jgi:uncharacterized phiE125 gp8 family phage protein
MALPVPIEDARRQLRLEPDDDSRDEEINGFVADAAGWVEDYTGHLLTAREVTEQFTGFRPVDLKAWPIAADAVPGVAYLGSDGAEIAITGARIDVSRRPARVLPGTGIFWPFRDSMQAFTVTIMAGYADPENIPRNLKRAMLILISAYDSDREGGDLFLKAEETAKGLCRGKRRTLL